MTNLTFVNPKVLAVLDISHLTRLLMNTLYQALHDTNTGAIVSPTEDPI